MRQAQDESGLDVISQMSSRPDVFSIGSLQSG